jgi:hypothetical protein
MAIALGVAFACAAAGAAADDLKELVAMTTVDRSRPFAIGRPDGDVEVWRDGDGPILGCHLVVFGPEWRATGSTGTSASGAHDATSRTARATLTVPGTDGAEAVYTAWAEAGGGGSVAPLPGLFESVEGLGSVRIRYRVEFTQAPALQACRVAFRVPVARHKLREVVVLGAETPARFAVAEAYPGTPGIWSGQALGVDIAPGTDDHIVVTSSHPIHLNVQDNREWGGDEIEVGFHLPLPEGPVPAGYVTEGEFTIAAAGLQFVPDASVAPSSNQTAEWFAFPLSPRAAPVDLSWLNDKPAGAHGFVTAREGRLVFEDGTPARFWGTCFSAGACFPTHENAEMIARRLAQVGVNIARLHHMDSDWGDVRLIDKSTGDTRHFDPASLDRLDYFIHCLKREGVYVYLDNLVNRRFTEKDGVEAADRLDRKAPPYLYFDPRLIELQKEYCTNLWTHQNPYTGLRYCDDPAIAVTEIVNEADAFTSAIVGEPYRSRLAERFRAWMRARGLEAPAEVDFTKKTGRMSEFLTEVMAEYFGEMRAHLRSLGVRVPVNGTNWSINSALLVAMEGMDLFDSHAYQCHPRGDGTFGNVPLVSEGPGAFCGWLAFNRVNGKPFSVSEWGEPWPNEWRAEMPLHLAYMAALQGWDGMAIYTYCHSAAPPPDYITGYFETFNDPALFGLFPHAALLYRRGDAAGARKRIGVKLGSRDEAVLNPIGAGLGALLAVETHRMEVLLPGRQATGVDEVVGRDEGGARANPIRSDTGEYERHFETEGQRGYAVIRTPRTAAAYGFLGGRGGIDAGAAAFDIATDFATVAVSSLTEEAIAESDDLLVTAVGRAENNRQVFDLIHRRLVSSGEGPIMVEPIRGVVTIRTRRKDLRCHALDAEGRAMAEVKLAPTRDGLELRLGDGPKTCYWRIRAGQ